MIQAMRGAGLLAALCLLVPLLGPTPACAHLLVAQKGTLNLVGDAGFLVLSVPVSSLQGVDDDHDGRLSRAEWQAHLGSIRAQLISGVQLQGPEGDWPLQLVMVDLASPDDAPMAPARQLSVMGRFQGPAAATATAGHPLTLHFTLFGTAADERQQDITVTRQQQTQWLRFEPSRPSHALLPGMADVLGEYLRTGAEHVLGGADHLLFLMVVMAAGWGGRALLGALSAFTLGHAATLLACAWSGASAPERLVEPAIAATIVAMAGFDAWTRWRAQPARIGVRLGLVFACAMIHGLGLSGALSGITQWAPGSAPWGWALLGFNLGIEAAQIGVAALAGLALWALRQASLPPLQQHGHRIASAAAMAAGTLWFLERVVQAA